jgi:hypothetical protein
VAVLRPFTQPDEERIRDAWLEEHLDRLDALAVEIESGWGAPQSAVALVESQRRG